METSGKGTAVLRAIIIKADGTKINLGIIDTSHCKWYDIRGKRVLRRMMKAE